MLGTNCLWTVMAVTGTHCNKSHCCLPASVGGACDEQGKQSQSNVRGPLRFGSPTPPSSVGRGAKLEQCAKVAELRRALMDAGFHSLGEQARALGLGRSTTWAILKAGHKSSGLSASVVRRMLRSANLPPAARRVIEEYVREKLAGTFGHGRKQLKKFRARLDQLDDPDTCLELRSA